MADRKNYGDNRWMIVYGCYQGLEAHAVNELYKVINANVPYILTVDDCTKQKETLQDFNIAFVGTLTSNAYLKQLADQGVFTPNEAEQGFSLKVTKSPWREDRKIAILCGADAEGTLYGVRDFHHFYVDAQRYQHFDTVYNVPFAVFESEMPDWECSDAPHFPLRGVWTWGHVIYDYKKYIDNLSQWKMNLLTLWNDYIPVNAKEVVEYAHSLGIKVVWGYSWCWGEEVDPNSAEDLDRWSKRIIETYETQYRPIHVDGLYFQTFTEHADHSIGGKSTAALAADWVNRISARLLEAYPDVWVQFGLHATSVNQDIASIATVDPRLNITWEDAGAFPFHHDPKNVADAEKTAQFTYEISRLRGEDEDFGVVLKGLTMLNWKTFEHQKGPFVLGQADPVFLQKYEREHEFIWRYANNYWAKNLDVVLNLMRRIKTGGKHPTLVTVLMEDGAWEQRVWSAGAMFAEAAWNPMQSKESILEKLGLVENMSR